MKPTMNSSESDKSTTGNKAAVRSRTSKTREDWNERYSTKSLIWGAKPNQRLADEVNGLAPGRALDLGAGEGRNALWLAESGWKVEAVELSDVAVEKARQLAIGRGVSDNVEFTVADLRNYKPGRMVYDLVVIMYLHLIWPDIKGILVGAAKAVAPGGTFLLIGHDLSNIKEGYGGPKDSGILYSAEQASGIVAEELNIDAAERIERLVKTDSGQKTAYDCLVRAHRF